MSNSNISVILPRFSEREGKPINQALKKMKFKSLLIFLALFFCLMANNCCVSSGANGLSDELKAKEGVIALPYHDDLAEYIKVQREKPLPEAFVRYESFFDKELQARGLPPELKFLPVSLTGMQTDYEKADRCGVWALPTLIGLHYGLTIDDVHDERFSMEASTRVALDYLSDLHEKYDDWWYCILAFSNSPNALRQAFSQSKQPLQVMDFYEQQLVPNAKVICELIACIYVYRDGQREELSQDTNWSSVGFSKPISIHLLAREAQLPVQTVRSMNPVFRSDVLVPMEGYSLALPDAFVAGFPMVEQKLYDETAAGVVVKTETAPVVEEAPQPKEVLPKNAFKYKVVKGNTLSYIAKKYHVTVSELMEWNHLETDFLAEGQELIIFKK